VSIERLVAEGPDPEGALPSLERFREAGGRVPDDDEGRALLVALLSNGSYLSDLLLSDVGALETLARDPFLRRPKPAALVAAEVAEAAAPARDFRDLQRRLRGAARREMLRLGAREVGWGATMEVARELAGLADACLEAAVGFCGRALAEDPRIGPPRGADEPAAFVVIGMGKLGGEELNFSSDVDLVYFYSTDEGAAGALTLHEHYARLSEAVTRALGETIEGGHVFRVDLRLRPEGRSGAICNSLAAAERYYETFGRTWERQAFLRARPCAGDRALGARLLETLAPFVFPRSLSPEAIEEVRALRRLFQAAGERAQDRGEGFDVKLGAGGIRDVELVAQALELVHAGKRRELRERSTLPALHKLALAGLLTHREERALAHAYRFLRRLEHRIQLEHGTQTHSLPAEPAALDRLARRLGFPAGEALLGELARVCQAVGEIAATLGEPAAGPSARVARLLDPASPRERLEGDLAAAGFRDVAASADALERVQGRLEPSWLEEAIASADPDRALARFRDLALRGSLGLHQLLREDPRLLRMLASLFGTSERLSAHLLAHPALWGPLVERLGAARAAPADLRAALAARLVGLDEEEALREMRRFQAEEILRIGLHDAAGPLEAHEVSAQLTGVAEACLGACVERVADTLAARHGRPDATLTVLALGSLGARELRYGSDLDLVFLYSREGETARGVDHQEWFARLAQRLIGALGARLDEGRLYDVDTRLRPSGEQGLLVTTYAAFDRYHHQDAAPWERVALLRARPVYVSAWAASAASPTDASLSRLLEEVTYERPLDLDEARRDLRHIRRRIETERVEAGARDLHLRFSPGGLTDLEMLAAFGQLERGRADLALRTTATAAALERLAATGYFAAGEPLAEDFRFLERAILRLRLLRERSDDRLAAADRAVLARHLGLAEPELDRGLAERTARIRRAFVRVIGAPEG
jgi:glutamate-ammonia-ligase adenylyltransferase